MNFKKYYINGWKYSIYLIYRGEQYSFEFEGTWNGWMYKLTLFTTRRYVIVEEYGYFSIYYKFYFTNELVEKWEKKEKALERVKELTRNLN